MADEETTTNAPWSTAQHDTIPSVDLFLNPLESHTYLSAFLKADGELYAPPYHSLRTAVSQVLAESATRQRRGQAPSATVTDQRFRTWEATFERMGFLRIDAADNRIRLTKFGRVVRDLYRQLNDRIEGANDHLAKLAVEILNKYALRNPLENGAYPEDADLLPFRLIWKVMRRLDNKLHSEELNRVIMRLNYRSEEDAAIEHIRQCRARAGGTYTEQTAQQLGMRSYRR